MEGLVAREVSQHPQLDLGVVGHQQLAVRTSGDERPADLPAQLAPDRDVLQVWVHAGKPPGGRADLVVGGVNPAGPGIHQRRQGVQVGGLQLGQLAIGQQCRDDGVLVLELLQDVGLGGRGPALHGPFEDGQVELVVQDGCQLGR